MKKETQLANSTVEASQVSVWVRFATHPISPVVLFAVAGFPAWLGPHEWLPYVLLALVAGHSLSGSV